MPKVEITLNDGSTKTIEFANKFTDADIDEAANYYNSQLKQQKPQEQPKTLFGGVQKWVNESQQKYEQTKKDLNEKFKAESQQALINRKNWEEKHPFISGIQKDYQPGYRAAVPQWEAQAKYGMDIPFKERVKTDIKSKALDLVPATNIGVDVATGGSGTIAKQGAKQGLKELIKQGAKQGLKTSVIGGATQGITSSLADNGITKDLITRPLQYAAIGGVIGAPLGVSGVLLGNATNNAIRKVKLNELLDKRKDWGIAFQKASGNPKLAIQTLREQEKGFVPNAFYKKGIGNIDLVWGEHNPATNEGYGLTHIIERRKAQGIDVDKFLEELPDTIENGIVTTDKNFPTRKYIEDPKKKISVELTWNEKRRKWIVSAFNQNKSASKRLMKNAPLSNITSGNGTRSIPKLVADNNIINDTAKKFNPPEPNNLFGGEVERVEGLLPETKQSKLTQTMADRGTLPEEFKGINPEYEVLHNADIANQATEAINTNPNKVLGELQQKAFNKDSELSALDFEMARQTVSKLYQEGRTEEALALTEQISQKASKSGQAVQALSLWSKTTPEGAVRYAQKIISDYNKKAKVKIPLLNETQVNDLMKLAQNTQATEIGTRENDIANQMLLKYFKELIPVSTGSKLRTLQNISLLLNPKTFLRNIGGNSIFATMDTLATKPIAAGLDKLASLKTGVRTRTLPQLKEYAQGLKQGFKEGVEDVGLGINTRDKLGTRFNLNDRSSFNNVPVLNQLEKALNYSLQVPDRMFYQAAYNESIANQMRAAGVAQPTAEMINNATNEALEAVFQNNSALGNMALKMRQAGNQLVNLNGYGLGDAFIPYAQTPANVAQQGINYSPLGVVKGIQSGLAGNQRQATMDIARGLTGSGLMGLGAYGAYNGIINPNIEDYKTQKNFEALGLKPNTINIGDYNVSYNQLQPLAAPIAGGAAVIDILNGDTMKGIDRSLGSVIDLGMLQSANKFMADMNDEGLGTATTNLAASIPSRFVPTGLKQITDLTDNLQRDTYDINPLKQGLNQAVAKIPGLNQTLPVKYDVTGQPVKKYQTEGLQRVFDATTNPVFVNKKKNDETVEKLIDLYQTSGDSSVLLPLADKKVRFKDIQGNPVIKTLNAKERNMYQQQLGTLNKEVLDGIVNTGLYDNLDTDDKIKLVNDTQRYIKGYVDEKLWDKPNAQKMALIKSLLKTDKDQIIKEILSTYKKEILPAKVNQIYSENF